MAMWSGRVRKNEARLQISVPAGSLSTPRAYRRSSTTQARQPRRRIGRLQPVARLQDRPVPAPAPPPVQPPFGQRTQVVFWLHGHYFGDRVGVVAEIHAVARTDFDAPVRLIRPAGGHDASLFLAAPIRRSSAHTPGQTADAGTDRDPSYRFLRFILARPSFGPVQMYPSGDPACAGGCQRPSRGRASTTGLSASPIAVMTPGV